MANLFKTVFFIVLGVCVCETRADTRNTEALGELVQDFRNAILKKDRDAFNRLFYTENPPFIAVFGNEMLEEKRKTRADYPATIDFAQYGAAVDSLISDTVDIDEVISNVRIIADEYIGVVYFDYIDVRDGVQNAHGTEAWSAVNQDGEWKIVSVIFSVNEKAVDG